MSTSMELVTDVLGDHGQRPREDYGMTISKFIIVSIISLAYYFVQ